MFRQLHEEIRLVVSFLSAALCVLSCCALGIAGCRAPVAGKAVSDTLPSAYADPELREEAPFNLCGQQLLAVCASPRHPAVSTHTPPYARLFLLRLGHPRPKILGWAECNDDVICERVAAFPEGKVGAVIAVISRPYGGSSTVYNLRVYRYNGRNCKLARQVTVHFMDGAVLDLRGQRGNPPAFLVAEPIYDVSKFGPQRFRFRLYVSVSPAKYGLGLTLVNKARYETCDSAYRAIRPRLQRETHLLYSSPTRF